MNTSMRMLVADALPSNRLSIEAMLNRIGQYRIVLVSHFDEVRLRAQYTDEPFDLLIINDGLARSAGVDVTRFLQGSALAQHLLVYNRTGLPGTHIPRREGEPMVVTLAGLPALESIRTLVHTLEILAQTGDLEAGSK